MLCSKLFQTELKNAARKCILRVKKMDQLMERNVGFCVKDVRVSKE